MRYGKCWLWTFVFSMGCEEEFREVSIGMVTGLQRATAQGDLAGQWQSIRDTGHCYRFACEVSQGALAAEGASCAEATAWWLSLWVDGPAPERIVRADVQVRWGENDLTTRPFPLAWVGAGSSRWDMEVSWRDVGEGDDEDEEFSLLFRAFEELGAEDTDRPPLSSPCPTPS